jgi:hypothetical protein
MARAGKKLVENFLYEYVALFLTGLAGDKFLDHGLVFALQYDRGGTGSRKENGQ